MRGEICTLAKFHLPTAKGFPNPYKKVVTGFVCHARSFTHSGGRNFNSSGMRVGNGLEGVGMMPGIDFGNVGAYT